MEIMEESLTGQLLLASPALADPNFARTVVLVGVHNDEGAYTGSNTLTGATAFSDNSIYAEVGLKVGTHKIAKLAHRMGITTPLSVNPAMTIGGLTVGVTPLDMAHAYETIAHGGERVSGSMAPQGAPVGVQEVSAGGRALPDGNTLDRNRVRTTRVLPTSIAATETSMLETVIQYGTGRAAAIGQFAAGKTGTTSNYGDAWFVGWDSKYTVAVWVGYPDKLVPMTTDFNGHPVLGGTFPALIWNIFMTNALQIDKAREEAIAEGKKAAHGGGAGEEAGEGEEGETSTTGGGSGSGKSGSGKEPGSGRGSPSSGSEGGVGTGSTGSERSSAPATPTKEEAPAEATQPPVTPGSAPPAGGTAAPAGGASPSG